MLPYGGDECVAQERARLSPLVQDALSDLGIPGFLTQACESRAAVREGSPERCDGLTTQGLRRGCRFRLAVLRREASACPADRVMPGRDPRCLAWATSNPRLCQALSPDQARFCRAVLANESGSCGRIPEESRALCEEERLRYPEARVGEGSHTEVMPTVLEISWTRSLADGSEERGSETFRFARWGVILSTSTRGHTLTVHDPLESPAQVGLRRTENRRFRLEASIPADRSLPARIACPEGCQLEFVGRGEIRLSTEEATRGYVDWAEFEPVRGGLVWLAFGHSVVTEEGTLSLRGRLRSFVRDIVEVAAPEDLADDGQPPSTR